jgi:hypothetical protein
MSLSDQEVSRGPLVVEAIPRIIIASETRNQNPVLYPWYCLAIRGPLLFPISLKMRAA